MHAPGVLVVVCNESVCECADWIQHPPQMQSESSRDRELERMQLSWMESARTHAKAPPLGTSSAQPWPRLIQQAARARFRAGHAAAALRAPREPRGRRRRFAAGSCARGSRVCCGDVWARTAHIPRANPAEIRDTSPIAGGEVGVSLCGEAAAGAGALSQQCWIA